MSERYYPIILAAISEFSIRIGIVWGPVDYAVFYSNYVKPDTTVAEIKTLEALYLERMARVIIGSPG